MKQFDWDRIAGVVTVVGLCLIAPIGFAKSSASSVSPESKYTSSISQTQQTEAQTQNNSIRLSYLANQSNETQAPLSPSATFSDWMTNYYLTKNFEDLSESDFFLLAGSSDGVSRAYFTLKRNDKALNPLAEKLATEIIESVEAGNRELTDSLLFPYFLIEVSQKPYLRQPLRTKAKQFLYKYGSKSCAAKSNIHEILLSDTVIDKSIISQLIDEVLQYSSSRDKQNLLNLIIKSVDKHDRDMFGPRLAIIASEFPKLMNKNTWLFNYVPSELETSLADKTKNNIEQYTKRRKCNLAENLIEPYEKAVESIAMENYMVLARKVAYCYKRKSEKKFVDFWETRSKISDTIKMKELAAYSQRELAVHYWRVDNFDKAKSHLNNSISIANDSGNSKLVFQYKTLMAKILINENSVDKAIEVLKSLSQQSNDGFEDFDESLKDLAVLLLEQKNYPDVLDVLQLIEKSQFAKDSSLRDDSLMGFTKFWQGKVMWQTGRKEEGMKQWAFAAREYYSSYYGAASSYLLGKIPGGKKLIQDISPSPRKWPEGGFDHFVSKLNKKEQLNARRALIFLKSGLRDQAVCEINEIGSDSKDDNNWRKLVSSMLFYASGKWLNSIKLYSNIPRDFRDNIPSELELILFPKKYDTLISNYSEKASVDPFLIMALIRQESIFNEHARSGVGAMGVMQLMPATARMELRKIDSDYLSSSRISTFKRKIRKTRGLYDVDINVPLGIHHVKSLLADSENLVFALASYNAGPGAVKKWRERFDDIDLNLFIEKIPYNETRNYVKLIVRNYFYYSKLYNQEHAHPQNISIGYLDAIIAENHIAETE